MNAVSENRATWAGDGPGGGPPKLSSILGEDKAQQDPPGICDFYGRDFLITPDVLIPRPETEQLIDAVLNLAGKPYLPGVKPSPRRLPQNLTILDVGTGSGCIAVTLAKELPNAKIYASDISTLALEIAQKNAAKHDAPITFIISHLLEKVNSGAIPTPDLVVANLPYVDETWDWLDKQALAKEPAIALYAKDRGLALIKELLNQATALHIKYLVLESDPCQHETIKNYAIKCNYNLIDVRGYILSFNKLNFKH